MSSTSYFVQSCANALQKFHRMHDHSARALQQRLDDQRGDFAVMLFEQALQRLDAIDVAGRARFSHGAAEAVRGRHAQHRKPQIARNAATKEESAPTDMAPAVSP